MGIAKAFCLIIIYFWLWWVSIAARLFFSFSKWGLLSSCSERASHCSDFSCFSMDSRGHGLKLWLVGSEVVAPGLWSIGSAVVADRLSCSIAWGIFLDEGLNPCLLMGRWILYHWAAREAPNILCICLISFHKLLVGRNWLFIIICLQVVNE